MEGQSSDIKSAELGQTGIKSKGGRVLPPIPSSYCP